MAQKYKCILFPTAEPPRVVKEDPMSLINGPVEPIRLTPDLTLLVHEEARLIRKTSSGDVSVILMKEGLVALVFLPCVLVRVKGTGWTNLTEKDVETFPSLRLLTPVAWRVGWV